MSITKALLKIRPGEQWVAGEDNYDDIVWLSKTDKPTREEVEAAVAQIKKEEMAETEKQAILTKLSDIDSKSIRSIREWVAKQVDAPVYITEAELEANAERAKLSAIEVKT